MYPNVVTIRIYATVVVNYWKIIKLHELVVWDINPNNLFGIRGESNWKIIILIKGFVEGKHVKRLKK